MLSLDRALTAVRRRPQLLTLLLAALAAVVVSAALWQPGRHRGGPTPSPAEPVKVLPTAQPFDVESPDPLIA